MIKRITSSIVIVLMIVTLVSSYASANDEDMKVILKDSMYGGLIGFVMGGAVLLFRPSTDNIELLGYGTGAGIIAGTVYGIYTTVAMFEYKEGNLHIGVPTMSAKVRRYKDKKDITVTAELLKFKF